MSHLLTQFFLVVCILEIMQIYLWYPLSVVTGGTTAKIMVAAKDNFLGKYIYKDTIARNLAAVIYRVRHLLIFTLFFFSYFIYKFFL